MMSRLCILMLLFLLPGCSHVEEDYVRGAMSIYDRIGGMIEGALKVSGQASAASFGTELSGKDAELERQSAEALIKVDLEALAKIRQDLSRLSPPKDLEGIQSDLNALVDGYQRILEARSKGSSNLELVGDYESLQLISDRAVKQLNNAAQQYHVRDLSKVGPKQR